MNSFDTLKTFNGQKYSGMQVGGEHNWDYPYGNWIETKLSPNKWKFKFTCSKKRHVPAPVGSGAPVGTGYHWYILADQRVLKMDQDTYNTVMEGIKFKMGHKRAYWKDWSYNYPQQKSYNETLILILKQTIQQLEGRK